MFPLKYFQFQVNGIILETYLKLIFEYPRHEYRMTADKTLVKVCNFKTIITSIFYLYMSIESSL
jgi:hypothetical protein